MKISYFTSLLGMLSLVQGYSILRKTDDSSLELKEILLKPQLIVTFSKPAAFIPKLRTLDDFNLNTQILLLLQV